MDSGTVMVLVLTLAAVVLLVLAERHCRRNEAKLKAESTVRTTVDNSASEARCQDRAQSPS